VTVFEPDRVVRALNDADVDYVIVGGLAVAVAELTELHGRD
jgi:hypothetical protein